MPNDYGPKTIFQLYPDLEIYLDRLTHTIISIFDVLSIILYGGIPLDDFSKKYSTIDIVVALNKSLWNEDYTKIDEVLEHLEVVNSYYSKITSIYFLPSAMIENPRIKFDDMEGVHTMGKEVELVTSYPLKPIDDFLIREKGHVMYGEDITEHFPSPPVNLFYDEFVSNLNIIEKWTKDYPFQHSNNPDYKEAVNKILYFPMILYGLKNNSVTGKTKAAYWFANEYSSDMGQFVLEVALARKKNLSLTNVFNIQQNMKKLLIIYVKLMLSKVNKWDEAIVNLIKEEEEGKYNYSRFFMELRNILI